jgi:hypothetical protein
MCKKASLIASPLFCLLFFLVLMQGCDPATSSSSSSKPRIPVGEKGIIDSGGTMECIAVTEEAFHDYRKTLRANDTQGTAELLMSGKCFTVDSGIKVLVIDSNASGLSQIRVLEGNKSGLSGWVPFEHVVKQAKTQ